MCPTGQSSVGVPADDMSVTSAIIARLPPLRQVVVAECEILEDCLG